MNQLTRVVLYVWSRLWFSVSTLVTVTSAFFSSVADRHVHIQPAFYRLVPNLRNWTSVAHDRKKATDEMHGVERSR